jgi:hypothetical protein
VARFPLYFDEDFLRTSLVRELRRLGWTVRITTEVGNESLPDEGQLEWSTQRGTAIVTSNQGDFSRLHASWLRDGRRHAGIIVVTDQRMSEGDAILGLELMGRRLDSLDGRLEFLAEWTRAARATG